MTPRRAAKLALLLGGLARWWLRPEVLDRAAEHPGCSWLARAGGSPPELDGGPGSCWVLFALRDQAALPALQPALVLPFRWTRGELSSPLLPRSLREEADQVVRELARDQAERPEHSRELDLDGAWGLHPGSWNKGDADARDLSRFEGITCRSAWAALAGGLILAASKIGEPRPDRSVWATGSWEPGEGVRPVDLLPEKLDLAGRFGARWVFVPESQCREARQIVGLSGVTIGPLSEGERSPWKALDEFRHRLDAMPGRDDPLGRRIEFFLRQSGPPSDAYYRSHLLPDLVGSYRAQVESRWPDRSFDLLIAIVSDGAPHLIPLEVGAFQPRLVWLLHTGDDRMVRRKEEVVEGLEGLDCRVVPVAFTDEEELRTLLPELLRSPGEPIEGPRVLDLTLGTKLMSLFLDAQARPEDLTVYWAHERRGNRVVPGSQRLIHRHPGSAWESIAPGRH